MILHLIFSLLIGAAAGYIAARLMGIDSSNMTFNCFLGLVGGVVFDLIGSIIGISASNTIGHLLFAVIGACICVWLYRKLKK